MPRTGWIKGMSSTSYNARLRSQHLLLITLLTGLLAAAPLSLAVAQDGVGEGDTTLSEEEEEANTTEDPAVANERDALTNRPTVTITRPEVPVDDLAEGDPGYISPKLRVRLDVNTKFIARDNLDFRSRDEDTILDVYDTDDRLTYGAGQARAGLTYRPVDQVSLDVGVGHNGLWGGDSLRSVSNTNTLFVDTLYFTWTPIETEAFALTLRTGRQYFEIGGAGDFGGQRRDYFFWDVVDGVTMDLDFGMAGKLRLLGLDIVGLQQRPDEVDFISRQSVPSADPNFRGDTSTYRVGGVYEFTELGGLEARAFGFYADVGAGDIASTGADRCFGGSLCNFADNDSSWMAGTRIGYFMDEEDAPFDFGVYAEYARSGGVDRKDNRVGLFDVSADGNAFGAGLDGGLDLGSIELDLGLQYFRADGGSYQGQNGMLFNYGFVGFKGAHVGGVAMDDQAGWHPSSYIGSADGVSYSPQDQRRESGTQVIFAGIGFGVVDLLKLDLGVWNLRDTGRTSIAAGDYDKVARDAPFGYGPSDIYAQRRLGKSLGNEFDFGLTLLASNTISLFAQGGIFVPGEFYGTEITRAAGTALGSDDLRNFWVVTTGINMRVR